MGCHSLLQGVFPTQGSNPGLPHCRQILYSLSHQGSFWKRVKTSSEGLYVPMFPSQFPHGRRSLLGYSPWDCKESDTNERLHFLSFFWSTNKDHGWVQGDGQEGRVTRRLWLHPGLGLCRPREKGEVARLERCSGRMEQLGRGMWVMRLEDKTLPALCCAPHLLPVKSHLSPNLISLRILTSCEKIKEFYLFFSPFLILCVLPAKWKPVTPCSHFPLWK